MLTSIAMLPTIFIFCSWSVLFHNSRQRNQMSSRKITEIYSSILIGLSFWNIRTTQQNISNYRTLPRSWLILYLSLSLMIHVKQLSVLYFIKSREDNSKKWQHITTTHWKCKENCFLINNMVWMGESFWSALTLWVSYFHFISVY